MKQSIKTQRPNIMTKNLKSDILGQSFKLEISMKARKCIMKAGSLDKYLLSTSPADIDSKFGLLLRDYIKKKQANPSWEVPYIPGTAKMARSRKTTVWEFKQIPAVYMSAKVKVAQDDAQYYIKTPQDMSRFEIKELEQQIKLVDAPEVSIPDDEIPKHPEYIFLKDELRKLQPIRHGLIKRALEKVKYQRRKRETLLAHIETTEEMPREVLKEEYVHYMDVMPGFREFLAKIREEENLRIEKEKQELLLQELEGDDEDADLTLLSKKKRKEIEKKRAEKAAQLKRLEDALPGQ